MAIKWADTIYDGAYADMQLGYEFDQGTRVLKIYSRVKSEFHNYITYYLLGQGSSSYNTITVTDTSGTTTLETFPSRGTGTKRYNMDVVGTYSQASGSPAYWSYTVPSSAQTVTVSISCRLYNSNASQNVDAYTITIDTKSGVIYIGNGSIYEAYQCYIGNGSTWDLYAPYVGNGSTFDLY